MTDEHGTVHGTVQIVSSGAAANRWNLVLLSEGYQLTEIEQYFEHARQLMRALRQTAPFARNWHAINVYRVDVSSTESGTGDPEHCPDDPASTTIGTGAAPHTYFDSHVCGQNVRRNLFVDADTARKVALAQVPDYDRILVLVNTPLYGGSGGNPVGAYSTGFIPTATALEVAIHELGHTAFGLGDEYGHCGAGTSTFTGVEPDAPNVTRNLDRETLKWRAFVNAGPDWPTQAHADCTLCDVEPSPVAQGTVGLFELAHGFNCGAYRPEWDCKMRSLFQPFCRVCDDAIDRVFRDFTSVEPTTRLDDAFVASPSVLRFFSHDGIIFATDVVRDFPIEQAANTVHVKSRTHAQAPPLTPAAGQFAYEYVVDLTRVVPTAGVPIGVARFEMDVGAIVRHSYAGGPTGPVELFKVIQGGEGGTVTPLHVEQTAAGRLVLRFSPGVMAGAKTVSMGFISVHPPRPAMIRIVDLQGRAYDVEGRGPAFS